ncbi:adenylate kinase 9 [Prorops nasuta]|uniref:adenylate kinase 9 n=1 Tax=Prorops nasuta TaxID=863751 RepID=UPI0034CE19E7
MEEIWHANHEEPQRFLDWEDIESAQERISLAVNEKFLNDVKQISDVKNSIKDTTIPWVKITTEKNQNKVWLELVKALQSYAQRNISLMERTQKITGEMAERLLDCGYYFLSSFGRFCPVQAFKRNIAINNFLPMEARHEIYPVIHRQYIYFLGGKEATSEFINDPLKYILQDSCLPLIVPRISIIGPPKSGKSTLAKKFASIYGMKVVTAGEGLRNALQNFPWTELARLTEEYLRLGNVALNESVSRAVEMSCIDPRASTQGYILDGFPSTREESEKLAFLGIQPMIVLDLKANSRFCLECLTRDANPTKKPANFSSEFLMHRYEKWRRDEGSFRNWLKKFAQNMVEVDGSRSKWGVWLTADRAVQAKLLSIQTYFREADYDVAHSLEHLCISPYEFRKHQSRYESFCPLCLFHDCSLNFSGAPPNSSGMFQFRGFYYWICPSHREEFLENPSNHLPPTNTSELPKERPKVLEEIVDVHHACWAKRLVANGVCLVTYADNLPRRKIEPGLPSIAVIYRDKLYLFCEEKCLQKFLCTPDKYATIKLHFPQALPKIDVNFLPNIGYLEQTVASRVPVPDARFDYLCEYFKPASKVPAFLNVVDIAGLVKGAAEGQGLGNAFLSNISACDGIFHLCRAFEDDDVTHVEGDVNPVRDLEIISEELRLKDVEFLNGHLDKLEKLVVRGNDKKLKPEYETLLKVKTVLVDDKRHIRFADWSANDIEVLNKYLFLTSKPVIYLVNLSEKDYIRKKNKWLMKIKEWVDKNDPGSVLIPFSGVFENKIVDMDDAERAKYFEENKVTSALDKIIVQGYKALQLQYFFTAGHDEVKAWTIQKGTKAPQAAGKIHTDFEKGFIMAEVMKYDDFKNEGSEAAVKAAGKYRQQGRNYVVEDGDIIFFKFNAGAGLKDAKKK